MPAVYSAVPGTHLIFVSISGLVTRTEALAIQDALLKDPAIGPGTDMLVHAIEARPDLSTRDIVELSRRITALAERGLRRIVIAADGLLAYALARIFSAAAETPGCTVHVFHTKEEALDWLTSAESPQIPRPEGDTFWSGVGPQVP